MVHRSQRDGSGRRCEVKPLGGYSSFLFLRDSIRLTRGCFTVFAILMQYDDDVCPPCQFETRARRHDVGLRIRTLPEISPTLWPCSIRATR